MTFGFTKTAPKLGKGININKPVKAINMKLENQVSVLMLYQLKEYHGKYILRGLVLSLIYQFFLLPTLMSL